MNSMPGKTRAIEGLDVKKIMVQIKAKARQHQMNDDLQRLSTIDLKDLEVEEDKKGEHKLSQETDAENWPENLSYINRHYSLTDHYNFVTTHRRGLMGRMVNQILSKLFLAIKVFIDRIVVTQETFNVKVVRLFNRFSKDFNTLSTRLDDQKTATSTLSTRLDDQKTKLEEQKSMGDDLAHRLEEQAKRGDDFAIQLTASSKKLSEQKTETAQAVQKVKQEILYPHLDIDYKKFEDRFRGEQSQIQERGKLFLNFFHECKEVLDIGCGRGEFIQNLHQYGSGAYGIDIDPGMVAECKKKQLNVIQQDAITHLNSLPNNHLDGIFADQLVEHLSRPDIIELVKLCYQKVKKGRFVVLTTPNIKSMVVYANSLYVDLSHITPVHPETLQFLAETAGFTEANLLFYSEVPESHKLKRPKKDKVMADNIDKLNLFLFGPQDYALIAKK